MYTFLIFLGRDVNPVGEKFNLAVVRDATANVIINIIVVRPNSHEIESSIRNAMELYELLTSLPKRTVNTKPIVVTENLGGKKYNYIN